jgi:hypothetical protein
MECGSLLPLSSRPACWPEGARRFERAREQARAEKSGSKLPHSKTGHHFATENSSLFSDRSIRTRQTRIRSPRQKARFECWPMMARRRSR